MEKQLKIGNIYKGIGNCGTTKDKEVIGTLDGFNRQWDEAILRDAKGRMCSVILKTLEEYE